MNAGRPLVLMYHAFGSPSQATDPHSLFVKAQDLDAQLAALLARRRPLDLDDFIAGWEQGGRWPVRRAMVTIDDGFRSTLELAAPILQRRGVPAVVFALPGLLGGVSSWMPDMADEPLLDANDLRELARQGLEIGCHGWQHDLMPGASDAELRRDTAEARDALADATGRVPKAFAYPDGQFDERAMRAVRAAGFGVAFSVHRDAGRYAAARIPVTSRDRLTTFRAKLLPGYLPLDRATRGLTPLRRAAARLSRQRPAS